MKAKVFVFGMDPNENSLFDMMLANTFREVTDEDGILYYPGVRDAAAEIGEAFRSADTVLFFAAEEMFAATKHILCRALSLRLRVESNLLARAAQSEPAVQSDTAAAICHAGVPEEGEVFALHDGLYTGFGVRRSRQTVVVLPAELSRTGKLLAKQVIPYLNVRSETPLTTDYAAHIYAYVLEERLRGADLTVAVSDTRTTALFEQYIAQAGDLPMKMPIAAKAEKRGNIPPNEYVVNLSITAAEFFHAPYGIAMSNAYYVGDDPAGKKKVYLAITSAEDSTVREITSLPGESTGDFLERCCGEMCLLTAQIIEEDTVPAAPELPEESQTPKNGRFHLLFSILLALIAVVFSFGIWYFMAHDYSLKDWAASYLPFVLSDEDAKPAGASEATAGETTTAERKTTKAQTTSSETTEEKTTEEKTTKEAATKKEETTKRETATKAPAATTRAASHTASPTLPAYYFTTENESETKQPETEQTTSRDETEETGGTAAQTQPEQPVRTEAQQPAETQTAA